MDNNTVGFVGFGEAASIFAFDIRKEIQKYTYDKSSSPRIKDQAEKTSTILVSSLEQLADKCTVIISLVTGSAAVAVAESIVELLRKEHLFIDFNSISPQGKIKVSKILEEKGLRSVDATVMGSVPELRINAPILLSGQFAKEADNCLKYLGFRTTVVSEKVGDAAAIKMVRSVFAKGLEGLFVEMLLAGNKYGVMEYVIDSISASLEGKNIRDVMNTLVVSQAFHSERKMGEMNYVIDVLNDAGVQPIMSTATRDTFKWITELDLKTKVDPDSATFIDIVNVIQSSQNDT